MVEVDGKSKGKRKNVAIWDRILIRTTHVATVLAALFAILHGTGLL